MNTTLMGCARSGGELRFSMDDDRWERLVKIAIATHYLEREAMLAFLEARPGVHVTGKALGSLVEELEELLQNYPVGWLAASVSCEEDDGIGSLNGNGIKNVGAVPVADVAAFVSFLLGCSDGFSFAGPSTPDAERDSRTPAPAA